MVVWKFNNLYKADAEKVSKEIESIPNATPSRILEYARNENSELHKCFEWDDTVKICYGNENALKIESEKVTQVIALLEDEDLENMAE